MAENTEFRPHSPWPAVWKGLVGGAVAGAALALGMPRPYVAEVGLLFPTLNSTVLKKVTASLKLDASSVDWNKTGPTSDAQMVQAARVILQSRAALESSFRQSKTKPAPTFKLLQGEPTEYFRRHNLDIEPADGTSLVVRVRYPRAEGARALCQGLLDYYTTFVHEHRLTNTGRTRQQLEEKLVRVDKRLTALEKKLLLSAENRFRPLPDSKLPADARVMRDLWKQRILEGGTSGRVLDEMRKIRKDAEADTGVESPADIGTDWRSRWGSTSLEDTAAREGSLPRTSRQADLPSRLELERVYEETLLLYNSGLLQYDFLSMWESLENFDFEISDPISVHQETAGERLALWTLIGGLAGCLLGLLLGLLLGRRAPKRVNSGE